MQNKKHAPTYENHMRVDQKIKQGYSKNAMEEGFAASSGVRSETAESGGRILSPELKDNATNTHKVSNHIEDENAGLADN